MVVIGYFTAPTRTYRYRYDTTGLRAAKSLDDNGVAGAGWSKEFTWDTSNAAGLVAVLYHLVRVLWATGDPDPVVSWDAQPPSPNQSPEGIPLWPATN